MVLTRDRTAKEEERIMSLQDKNMVFQDLIERMTRLETSIEELRKLIVELHYKDSKTWICPEWTPGGTVLLDDKPKSKNKGKK